MQGHPLYESPSHFDDVKYLMPQVLSDFTNDTEFAEDATQLEICPTCFFQTSGTTSRSKRIPYSSADLERQKQHEAQAFRMLGMTSSDVVLTLGSPLPSISGWATINGSEAVGASVVNTSHLDYEDVFLRKMEKKVTFVFATPIVAREIGLSIQAEKGQLKDVFPNLRTAVIFGDVLPDNLRNEIKELWGFQNVVSLYGTVEADVVAVECMKQPGHQHFMLDRLLIEAIPEHELEKERKAAGYHAKAVRVSEVKEDMIGEIVISDLKRDILPLLKYRIGDIIKVSTADCGCGLPGPTGVVLGRSKNIVFVDDVPVYEMQINGALEKVLGSELGEWRITYRDDSKSAYALYVVVAEPEKMSSFQDAFWNELRNIRPELASMSCTDKISVVTVENLEQAPLKGDAKARRIVLD